MVMTKLKINKIEDEVNSRVMINKIPKGLSRKKEKELIANEFLIEDEKGEVIISGGGRVGVWLLINSDPETRKKDIIKRNSISQYRELLYLLRKLEYFKLDYNEFDANKVISNE